MSNAQTNDGANNNNKTFRVIIRDYVHGDFITKIVEAAAGPLKGGALPSVIIDGRAFAVFSTGSVVGRGRLITSCISDAGAHVHPDDLPRLKAASIAADRNYWAQF